MAKNKCYLDSNVLIAFLERPHQFHRQAVEILIRAAAEQIGVCVSPLTLDETIHIVLRDLRLKRAGRAEEKVAEEIKKLWKIPLFEAVSPPNDKKALTKIPGFIKKYKLRSRDAFHLLTMEFHKIKYFATFDNDFNSVFSETGLRRF